MQRVKVKKIKKSITYTQLSQKDIAPLREKLHKEQNEVCPILGIKIPFEEATLDHKHRKKNEPIGNDGAGLCRGAIHFSANAFEGRVTSRFRRQGLAKYGVTLPTVLRNLADYLEQPPLPFIHPSEKPKKRKVQRSCYNALVKVIKVKSKKTKIPPFPKSGKLTVKLEKLFKEFNVPIKYYV